MKSLLLTLTLALYVTECKATKGYQRRLSGDEWDENDRIPCKPGMILNSNGCCDCPPGSVLVDGKCECPDGQVLDGGKCECPGDQVFDGDECICLGGQVFDGVECRCPSDKWIKGICQPCPDGQVVVGDKCCPRCPPGKQISSKTKTCVCVDSLVWCPSGITPGKCYILTFENGQNFGYHEAFGFYTALSDYQFSKFQVCSDEFCSPDEDIQAGASFNLQEIYGELPPASEEKERIFVNNAKDGAFMTRTLKFKESADFVITKWPGGKHCLGGSLDGGAGAGLGLDYKAGRVGATVLTGDDQACVVMTFTEVPCDIRGKMANCIGGNTTAAAA